MPAITTILFDLGKTLVWFDFKPVYEKLVSLSNMNPGALRASLEGHYDDFAAGKQTPTEWHEFVQRTFDIAMPWEEFAPLWADIFWENPDMFALARETHPRYRQYLLSNTDAIHFPWCLERFPLGEVLDGYMLSYELGAVKPQREIYERGLAKFGLKPEECVFIDDLEANLEGARSFGIHTVKCVSVEQVRRDLKALGVG
jgi:putative hydrolase of the HAD superfamily